MKLGSLLMPNNTFEKAAAVVVLHTQMEHHKTQPLRRKFARSVVNRTNPSHEKFVKAAVGVMRPPRHPFRNLNKYGSKRFEQTNAK